MTTDALRQRDENGGECDGWLGDADFRQVVAHTPLVSLDFVVTDAQGAWLLGQRLNRPAQGYWFVPGGRVRKNETLAAAARRLTETELGRAMMLSDMCSFGVYQHFYSDSMLAPELSTHYVVLAYQVSLSLDLESLPCDQHSRYRWWSPAAIANDPVVHANTRGYLPAVTSLIHEYGDSP
ncbi:GDP-mannose mannosyl hydrolase [Halomonas rhizosphaerae]|uniref:GDP-mannose mannosyl hydrolase n=1 Tax=Halomonas rhizosphaerae TaxID=3043296 RepID=A0ABT6UYF9_9GAMM|nr:GDP-mannose mannosyl hydrolase [Halomonas rhizosphaerae]MDI5890283.1 GDP-mannose mannosyl hydrolase [Halomonas rhizosphaerae]